MPDVQLILGDCADKLKEIPDASIDLVVTSPPYDNLRTYKGYSFDFETIARELYRVIKQCGVIVWIVGDATINGSETGTSFRQALFFKNLGLNLHDTMIWQKSKMPQNHNRYEQFFEYMFIFSKGKPYTFNGIRDKINTEAGATAHASYRDKDGIVKKTSSFNQTKIAEFGLRYNIWAITPCLSKENRVGHPAPFPLQIAKDHIISWSNEGDTILDPFMGSGTTGLAAIELNRKFIGIEIATEYFEMAKQRIEPIYELWA
jgi:site-specific DNA-methyltransferase (adenine-specific)